ncbi:hypothetical protein OF83DRAFT_1273383 [Amylostereum chailletii]|nr:hypothetical protein OF83DRAFT_1273383 [Amylostereum chailletii]
MPAPTPTPAHTNFRKRPRTAPVPSDVIELSDDERPPLKKIKGKLKVMVKSEKSAINITRQTVCDRIVTLKQIPTCWDVAEPGESIAYLLDLREDTREWKDKRRNQPLTMAAIIKSQDQDAWGGGTVGTKSKPSKVYAFGDGEVLCQTAEHTCQGIFHCSELDMSLVDGCLRYAADPEERRELWEAERAVHERTADSMESTAISFYNEMLREQCDGDSSSGRQCGGMAVIRPTREKNYDGEYHFIGCSNWRRGDPAKAHMCVSIPKPVNEYILLELFKNDGVLPSASNSDLSATHTGQCALVVPPRNAKGLKRCPYPHVDNQTRKAIEGHLTARPCPTKIKIWFPIDDTDHRAIVMLTGGHNHPMPPNRKVSREGKDAYMAAARVMDVAGLTTLKTDRAASTVQILGGCTPEEFDPALANSRQRRKLIKQVKQQAMPLGNGIEGVFSRYRDEQSIPASERYIQEIRMNSNVDIIVTMLPALAECYHSARFSLHDDTYKRLHGNWKEWEVVIWHHRLNIRLTVARIYCQRETREAFRTMWSAFFDGVKTATGRAPKFKFMHGEGLRVILVDGCKAQIDACGDTLVNINNALDTPLVVERDPQVIVQYILKTCSVHLDRGLSEVAAHCPPDVMDRVRRFKYLETENELDDFKAFCKGSPHKKLQDWFQDKEPYPWFFPSLNPFFSKIPTTDWYNTPDDTNLNESSHTLTNAHTGIDLPLLEAIESARKFDASMAMKIAHAEDNHVLANHRNTVAHRLHANRLRRDARQSKAAQYYEGQEELEGVSDELEHHVLQVKALRERKKALQQSGIKKMSNSTKASRTKAVLEHAMVYVDNKDMDNIAVTTTGSERDDGPDVEKDDVEKDDRDNTQLDVPSPGRCSQFYPFEPTLEPPLLSSPARSPAAFIPPDIDQLSPSPPPTTDIDAPSFNLSPSSNTSPNASSIHPSLTRLAKDKDPLRQKSDNLKPSSRRTSRSMNQPPGSMPLAFRSTLDPAVVHNLLKSSSTPRLDPQLFSDLATQLKSGEEVDRTRLPPSWRQLLENIHTYNDFKVFREL